MSKPEPLIPGKYYHIYNRGNNRETLFRSDENYLFFLQRYAKYIEPVAATYAYCLMSNYFHFLSRMRTEEEQRAYHQSCQLSESWQLLDPSNQFKNLFISYSMAFNRRYKRTGSLFEKPFKRKPVENEHYLAYLVTYIHHNPQRHGFVEDFREWNWSSYQAMLSGKPTKVARDEVLEWFGGREWFAEAHQLEVDETVIESLILDD